MAFAHGTLLSLLPDTGVFHGGHCCHPPRGRCNTVVQLARAHPRSPDVETIQERAADPLWTDQEIIVDFFLLPLDDYEAVLGIEWLTTLGDVF
ncbi:hypothetical protein B296_00056057 [Ensete ventricosum]|uniref:Uncharacterized protein n=1 Tax=Ensete ventricosum TaxID=4639 RepID=A0A426XIE0_ENSVE|nr:hypothetical protein B296_00056057 [Ensete ventricosum]